MSLADNIGRGDIKRNGAEALAPAGISDVRASLPPCEGAKPILRVGSCLPFPLA